MALPWLKLFKQIVHNALYFSEPFDRTHAWIDLLLLAKDEDQEMMIGLKKVSVPRGDVTESFDELATRWKWSKTKVARFMDFLEEEGMIEKKRNGRNGSVTIVKYGFFQGDTRESGTIAEQSRNDDGTIAEQSNGGKGDIYNNNISNLERKRVKDIPPICPPTKSALEAEFEDVWQEYPKKHGKQNALNDFIRARKSGTTLDEIKDGLASYNFWIAKTATPMKYVKNGSTWFHQKCWEDVYEVYDNSDQGQLTKAQQSAKDVHDSLDMMRDWAKERSANDTRRIF